MTEFKFPQLNISGPGKSSTCDCSEACHHTPAPPQPNPGGSNTLRLAVESVLPKLDDLAIPLRPTRFCYDPEHPQSPQHCTPDDEPKPRPTKPKPKPKPLGCPSTCNGDAVIIGCDQRTPVPLTTQLKFTQPYKHVGRLDNGATATLIRNKKWILTTAHALVDFNFMADPLKLGFALNLYPGGCNFKLHRIIRGFIPKLFSYAQTEAARAYDWGIAELKQAYTEDYVQDMDLGQLDNNDLLSRQPFSIGYPSQKESGQRMYSCGVYGDLIKAVSVPGGGGVLHHNLDGTGGQSGSPIYVIVNGIARVVGVMVGSPADVCKAGINWASQITDSVRKQIMDQTSGIDRDELLQIDFTPPTPDDVFDNNCNP